MQLIPENAWSGVGLWKPEEILQAEILGSGRVTANPEIID
jgi:hypothetical protein